MQAGNIGQIGAQSGSSGDTAQRAKKFFSLCDDGLLDFDLARPGNGVVETAPSARAPQQEPAHFVWADVLAAPAASFGEVRSLIADVSPVVLGAAVAMTETTYDASSRVETAAVQVEVAAPVPTASAPVPGTAVESGGPALAIVAPSAFAAPGEAAHLPRLDPAMLIAGTEHGGAPLVSLFP